MQLNPAPEMEAAASNSVKTTEFDPQRNRADASQMMRQRGGGWMGVLALGADCNHTGSKIEVFITRTR